MAGHSQFKNIMHRKGAQDAKRAKVFTKIIRELTVAAKSGSPNPEDNPRLRSAIAAARGANMPKDTMERAIKRGTDGGDMTNYEEIRYEGYGPAGSAIIVEALTDNRNRTASEVRSTFTKYGGNLGETNSVSFMFDRVGCITLPLTTGNSDVIFEAAIEAGAEDVESSDEAHTIYCAMEDLHAVADTLSSKFGAPEAKLVWRPKGLHEVTDAQAAQTLMKFLDILEDNDDVQEIFTNVNFDTPLFEGE